MVTRMLNIKTNQNDIIQAYKNDDESILITRRYIDSESAESTIYLEKEEAKALGEELVKLSEQLIK